MGEIRISLPDSLHQSLKERAVKERKSLKRLVTEMLEKEVKKG